MREGNTLLWLAYRGTAYHGFQVQKNALTVCEVVQDAMEAVLGARPDVKGCSRTDAGVHARRYALSFKAGVRVPLERLPLALNAHLPGDIRVLAAHAVPEGFHARYSALGKEYTYTLLNAPVDDPFCTGLYHRVSGPLDINAMNEAAAGLRGRHDFAAFMAAGSSVEDTVRCLHTLEAARSGPWLCIRAGADGFLYNMVRILAGTLLLCGQGRMSAAEARAALDARRRERAGPTLPAGGLCLNRVFYPAGIPDAPQADFEGSVFP